MPLGKLPPVMSHSSKLALWVILAPGFEKEEEWIK